MAVVDVDKEINENRCEEWKNNFGEVTWQLKGNNAREKHTNISHLLN